MKVKIEVTDQATNSSEMRIMTFKADKITTDKKLRDFVTKAIDEVVEAFKAR